MSDPAAAKKKNDDIDVAAAPKRLKRKPYDLRRTHDIIMEGGKKLPQKWHPYVDILAWILALVGLVFTLILPSLRAIYFVLNKIWVLLKPFHPEHLAQAIAGLLCCFYGGIFQLVVASAEAWRAASWEENKKDLRVLYDDWLVVSEQNKQDALKDEDGNGIADVDELDATRYFLRKVNLVLVSVNPETLSEAFNHLYMAGVAVVAALKLRFARAVALGNSLGDIASGPVKRIVAPVLRFVLPQDYKKWAGPVVGFAVKFAAIQVAWALQRVISTVHSAVRGGFLFARGVLSYMRISGWIKLKDEDTYIDEVVGIALACCGFYFQTQMAWKLPFPINVLLLPLTLLETTLSYYVAS